MSSYLYNSSENEPEEAESVTLIDEKGRTLDCYIENSLEADDQTYLLLMPVDIPIVVIAWDEEGESDDDDEEEEIEAVLLEDYEELEQLFDDAKAVLAELDLSLKYTGYTLTVSGELPPIEDDDILTLELEAESEDQPLEPEELQYLVSFYQNEQRYSIYTPLAPLLFLAKYNPSGKVVLVSPEDGQMQQILEELLFEE
ncbi:MAG: DUF3727 domain-containing protein [Microcystaceae cyanobacterium]